MSSVYVLYTGGTIGSFGDPLGPMTGPQFTALVESMPGLGGGQVAGSSPLVTYTIDWLDPTLDSSNMTPSDWVTIAQRLASNYAPYDGFVVLHGTDTMAFTASALSFLLPGLSKPVILTGSQLPLSYTLNDALPNLVGAIVLAGTTQVPESCLYFDSTLLRGNRSVKVDASRFGAFRSPNFPPLGTVGTETTINTALVLPPPPPSTSLSQPANLEALQNQLASIAETITTFSVIALILYPGVWASTVSSMLDGTAPPVSGLVIEAFGEGNGPSNATPSGAALLQVLTNANAAGIVMMDNTQVLAGTVNNEAYATGSGLAQAGALSAYDMTPESSLSKLVYLFACGVPSGQVKTLMQQSLAGEITPPDAAGTTSYVTF
jgi:L-asparaginase